MALRLHSSCENFVGQTIYVWPYYGWGWVRYNPLEGIEVPPAFLLRVVRLTHHLGKMNGFLGRVEEPEHEFNGLRAVAYLRHGDNSDLISSIPLSDIFLGPNEPIKGNPSDNPARERYVQKYGEEPWYPLWKFDGSPQYGGHVQLAASGEIHASESNSWKYVNKVKD